MDAVDRWTRAIRIDPRDAQAYRARGAELARLGELERAGRDFAEAHRLDPDPNVRYYRGLEFLRMDEPGRAVAEFTHAIRIDPEFLSAIEGRWQAFLDLGDRARAATDARTVRRIKAEAARTVTVKAAAVVVEVGDLAPVGAVLKRA